MPKMKSHSGAKKRFRTTASGKVKSKGSWTQHRLVSKSKAAKLRNRGTFVLNDQDARTVKRVFLPYDRS